MPSPWMQKVEQALRQRPASGPVEETEQDAYYDSGQTADGADVDVHPWLDGSAKREREC